MPFCAAHKFQCGEVGQLLLPEPGLACLLSTALRRAFLPATAWQFIVWQTQPCCLLPQERKELIGKKLNEQHSNWGSLLLGLGVTISVAGGFNTFLRTGEGLNCCASELRLLPGLALLGPWHDPWHCQRLAHLPVRW